MTTILHISDLHFVNNASSYNVQERLIREVTERTHHVPLGQKLLIITGDFHNYLDTDYESAEVFLRKLIVAMGLDVKQDVFIVPGNHDVGNGKALEHIFRSNGPNLHLFLEATVTLIKQGETKYISERLRAFRPYCIFAQRLGIYDAVQGEDYPAQSHVRCWRNKLNILHLNTALVADGKSKESQMTDVDQAINHETWKDYQDTIPALAIGHNSVYDLERKQRDDLRTLFALRNVSAYLCGDPHFSERDSRRQTISLENGARENRLRIPIISCSKVTDATDSFSPVEFNWHFWEESSNKVNLEYYRVDSKNLYPIFVPVEWNEGYIMRHIGSRFEPSDTSLDAARSREIDSSLQAFFDEALIRTRNYNPSFQLMKADEIDKRLYPEITGFCSTAPLGYDKTEKKPKSIWDIIVETWRLPERHNVIISGSAGLGKTVTLFSITDIDPKERPIAIYIPLIELIGEEGNILTITEYLRRRFPKKVDEILSLATKPWKGPLLLLLLDGVNEIPSLNRREVLFMINAWCMSYPSAQLIITTRPLQEIDFMKELSEQPIVLELGALNRETVQEILRSQNSVHTLPSEESTLWSVLTNPLFLTLYRKADQLASLSAYGGYPLDIKNQEGPGTIIWNYLQRELLRVRSEKWVIRCAIACEYILPHIAWVMVRQNQFAISDDAVFAIIRDTVQNLDPHRLPTHLSSIFHLYEKRHLKTPDLASIDWNNVVLREISILVSSYLSPARMQSGASKQQYCFIHRTFRDCLAGIYLVNQSEMEAGRIPAVWRDWQNPVILGYAAELMQEETALSLWEKNREIQQCSKLTQSTDHNATSTLLELWKYRVSPKGGLDFSGMDLRNLSLVHYIESRNMELFVDENRTKGTLLDIETFSNQGHITPVTCMAVLRDGRLVSGSSDRTLRIWDTITGRCLHVFKGHSLTVSCLVVLPDGRIVSGSDDQSLRVWNLTTGLCMQIMEGHSGAVTCATALPDGRIVSGSEDHTLHIWDPDSGCCLSVLTGHVGSVTCLTVLPDGRIASGSKDHTLRVWNVFTGQCEQVFSGHTGWINCIASLPDGRIVTGSNDQTIRVWAPSTGQCLNTLIGHTRLISCLAISPGGRIVSGSSDHTLRIWDSMTGQCLQTLIGHRSRVDCVATMPDEHIISGSYDKTLRLWDAETGNCLQELHDHTGWICSLGVLPDRKVVTGSVDNSLRTWDLDTGKCLNTIQKLSPEITCITSLLDGLVVCGTDNGTIRVWDTNRCQCLRVLKDHTGGIICVTHIPNGRFVSGSRDNTLRVWDAASGKCLQTLKGHRGEVNCVAVLPDGRVVSGSADNTLRVWDAVSGQCLQIIKRKAGSITSVCALPNGNIVSGSSDGSVSTWNPKTGKCNRTIMGHSEAVCCLAVFSDGRVISGSLDNTLLLWDQDVGKTTQRLTGHNDSVSCVAISEDGYVISGSSDNTLRVWNTVSGESYTLEGHSKPVTGISYLGHGLVVSGSKDGTLRLWAMSSSECRDVLVASDVDVSKMRFSQAVLTPELEKLLRQNGANLISSM